MPRKREAFWRDHRVASALRRLELFEMMAEFHGQSWQEFFDDNGWPSRPSR